MDGTVIIGQEDPKGTVQRIHRLYEAHPEFKVATPFFQQSTAQVLAMSTYPNVLQVSVDPRKAFRTVWAWIYMNNSAQMFIDYDLVAAFNGMEIYREKLIRQDNTTWSSSGTTLQQFLHNIINPPASWPGCCCESIITSIQGAMWQIMPITLNLTCDTIVIQINSISGTINWDGQLMVRSQAGV